MVLVCVVAVLALDPPPGKVAAADAATRLDHPLLLQNQRQSASHPGIQRFPKTDIQKLDIIIPAKAGQLWNADLKQMKDMP